MYQSLKMARSKFLKTQAFNYTARLNPKVKYPEEQLKSFEIFNKMGAKFRVAVVNKCNFNCFFCHNEGMKNPRSPGDNVPLSKTFEEEMNIEKITKLMNDFCELGGTQLNVTGGEPLVRKDIVEILKSIDKRDTLLCLNSNVLLAERLLKVPKVDNVDAIYASLHTTKEEDFKNNLGIKGGAKKVMDNMVLLQKHGYKVLINYSLGQYNKHEFESVMDFAIKNQIILKAITLIRSKSESQQYGKNDDWCDPRWLEELLTKKQAKQIGEKEGFGGRVREFRVAGESTHKIIIKNVGRGRLITDYCKGCKHFHKCGEGVYALRSGVDGVWKPCLLNNDKHDKIEYSDNFDYKSQILEHIHNMVGDWKNHSYYEGAPL